MDYAVIQNNLTNKEIHPKTLTATYVNYLREDINDFFSVDNLHPAHCPTNGESLISRVFQKMGFQYLESKSFGNIYLSPRPSQKDLLRFYETSKAREFWYKNLFRETESSRRKKILENHLSWIHATASEHGFRAKRKIAEINPVLWSYGNLFTGAGFDDSYALLDPLFSANWAGDGLKNLSVNPATAGGYNVVCLLGALNRAFNPRETLDRARDLLVPKGLCFMTEVLSSGFEIKTLGADSSIILPPEKMNLFSYEGLEALIKGSGFEILEFSTPGLLDMENALEHLATTNSENHDFFTYVAKFRKNPDLVTDFQQFLQTHKLSSIARLVLIKN